MSNDPFEMEWWNQQAQKYYRQQAPKSDKLNWNARQKALEQGAYSTLATLLFTHYDAQAATAELLVVGDSCVLIGHQEQVIAFLCSMRKTLIAPPTVFRRSSKISIAIPCMLRRVK